MKELLKQIEDTYGSMFKEAKKEEPEKIKGLPNLETLDGVIEFAELMTKKDKKKHMITIIGIHKDRNKI